MRKYSLLGCSALLFGMLAIDTSAHAGGRYHGCGCYDPRPYFPVYAPPTYTSL